jgi:hypothetical protein
MKDDERHYLILAQSQQENVQTLAIRKMWATQKEVDAVIELTQEALPTATVTAILIDAIPAWPSSSHWFKEWKGYNHLLEDFKRQLGL